MTVAASPPSSLASDTPKGRVYDNRRLLKPEVIVAVYEEFRRETPRIFGEDLAFGFIFGGFAKGYAVENQDADMLLCLHRMAEPRLERFREWYFDLHRRYQLTPDRNDPGEVMTPQRLEEKLLYAAATPLRPVIETYYEYEAIVWADVLVGEKAAFIGDLAILDAMTRLCDGLPQRWRGEMLRFHGDVPDPEVAKLPTTRLFRRSVTYLKEGDNSPPSVGLGGAGRD